MKGLELAKAYFNAYGKNLIEKGYGEYMPYFAVGLVGEGSECYGYDDDLSQDHDFGPGFCIWLPDSIYAKVGAALQDSYNRLPKTFDGYTKKNQTIETAGRVGVFSIEGFYHKYTNCGAYPKDNVDWFKIPERFLSIATNGVVFMDALGEFTKARQVLQAFYPEDVLRKKLAARVAVMSQSGQYNYARTMKRGDYPAAYLACYHFVNVTLSTIHLLNGVYMPFYKWAFKSAESLPLLKNAVAHLKQLTLMPDVVENQKKKEEIMALICRDIGQELNRRGFSDSNDFFLERHCKSIMYGIKDNRLRTLHVMADFD